MRTAPQVLEGLRAGRQTPGQVIPEGDRSDAGLYARISALLRGKNLIVDRPEKTPYEVIFASRYSHLMVQVTAPEDIIDGKTGRKTRGRPVVCRFQNSLYSVPKKHSLEVANDIVAWLRAHVNYGPGMDFWEQKTMENEATIRRAVQVIEAVSENQSIRETVLEYLTQTDFVKDETGAAGNGGTGRVADLLGGSTVVGSDPDEDEDQDDEDGPLGGEGIVDETALPPKDASGEGKVEPQYKPRPKAKPAPAPAPAARSRRSRR